MRAFDAELFAFEVTKTGDGGAMVDSPPSQDRGNGRNEPYTTDFSGLGINNPLCTTPIPLPTSSRVLPGYAPQVSVGERKTKAVQQFAPIAPYRRSASDSLRRGPRVLRSRGETMTQAPS